MLHHIHIPLYIIKNQMKSRSNSNNIKLKSDPRTQIRKAHNRQIFNKIRAQIRLQSDYSQLFTQLSINYPKFMYQLKDNHQLIKQMISVELINKLNQVDGINFYNVMVFLNSFGVLGLDVINIHDILWEIEKLFTRYIQSTQQRCDIIKYCLTLIFNLLENEIYAMEMEQQMINTNILKKLIKLLYEKQTSSLYQQFLSVFSLLFQKPNIKSASIKNFNFQSQIIFNFAIQIIINENNQDLLTKAIHLATLFVQCFSWLIKQQQVDIILQMAISVQNDILVEEALGFILLNMDYNKQLTIELMNKQYLMVFIDLLKNKKSKIREYTLKIIRLILISLQNECYFSEFRFKVLNQLKVMLIYETNPNIQLILQIVCDYLQTKLHTKEKILIQQIVNYLSQNNNHIDINHRTHISNFLTFINNASFIFPNGHQFIQQLIQSQIDSSI